MINNDQSDSSQGRVPRHGAGGGLTRFPDPSTTVPPSSSHIPLPSRNNGQVDDTGAPPITPTPSQNTMPTPGGTFPTPLGSEWGNIGSGIASGSFLAPAGIRGPVPGGDQLGTTDPALIQLLFQRELNSPQDQLPQLPPGIMY